MPDAATGSVPRRRAPVHLAPIDLAGRSAILLVTVCTRNRRKVLACPEAFELLVRSWRTAGQWRVGRFVVLPDHLHLFCAATAGAQPLAAWIKYWKSFVARRWPRPDEQPLWQRDFWDRQLRSSEHYEDRWDYVRYNPVRHGLVSRPDEWPYQGELDVLEL